jgi:hypothetical protein
LYQQLCWAKHGNPVLTSQYAAAQQGDLTEVLPSQHVSAKAGHFARFAMLHSIRAVYDVVTFFAEHHLAGAQSAGVCRFLANNPARIDELGGRDGLIATMHRDGSISSPAAEL